MKNEDGSLLTGSHGACHDENVFPWPSILKMLIQTSQRGIWFYRNAVSVSVIIPALVQCESLAETGSKWNNVIWE